MNASDLITIDPEILGGTPVFRGTRVPVQTLFQYLESSYPLDEFLECFPTVTREVAEKMSALLTLDYLRAEAAGAKREDFESFLAAVPDVEPVETDRVE